MEALQAELAALKSAGASLRRAPAGAPGAPFPIHVKWSIDAPPDGALFDVPAIGLTATLPSLEAGREGVEVAVTSGLPPRVAAAAAGVLRDAWLASATTTHPLSLAALPALAVECWLSLLTALPGCVEAYEACDAAGRTVRRKAVVDPDAPAVEVAGPPPPPPRPPPQKTATSPLDAELAYLARRFKDRLELSGGSEGGEGGDGGAPRPFTLTVTPTDPEWTLGPVRLEGAACRRTFPGPGSLTLAATAPRGPATAALSRRLAARVDALAGRPDGLRAVVRLVENAASELGALSSSSSDEEEEEGGSDEEGGQETRAARPPPAAVATTTTTLMNARPVTVRLTGLRLDNVDALTPAVLTVQAGCGGCGAPGLAATFDFGGAAGSGRGVVVTPPPCSACGATGAVLEALPRIAHAGGNAIARLRCGGGCRPLDLIAPTVLSAQCGRCEGGLAGLRMTVGAVARRKCPACFAPDMAASFQGVAFEEAVSGGGGSGGWPSAAGGAGQTTNAGGPSSSSGRARRPSHPHQAPLVPGTPLPATGTCRHYPHSHRWLRFPCCGRLAPCDLCHEVASPECPSVWATRHVCGFCSVEQRISATPDGRCGACGKRLAASAAAGTNAGAATTKFWEGGQGCRDRSKMDPRDRRRYAGLAKTQSRKASRVGPKPGG
jgi:hypothetical protein